MIEPIRFTPPWLVPAAPAGGGKKGSGKIAPVPVFLLKAGTILERDQFEAELEGRHAAGMVLSFHLLEAAVGGLRALLGKEDAAEIEDLLRSDYSAAAGDGSLSPQERAKVKGATEILAKHWPDYSALVEQEARRSQILPTLAFVQWCSGWENVTDQDGAPVEYARGATGEIDDALLRRVPFTMIRSAGMAAYGLQYGRSQAKN